MESRSEASRFMRVQVEALSTYWVEAERTCRVRSHPYAMETSGDERLTGADPPQETE